MNACRGTLGLAAIVAALGLPASARAEGTDDDPFYAAPAATAQATPGTILRSREVDLSASRVDERFAAWQLLYRTNDTYDAPEAAAATVIVPRSAAPEGGRSLVAYQTAEDALTTRCAPSFTLRQGTEKEASNVQMVLDRGFAVVVPDYEGPDSQWSAGVQEGHATLDAIRAAQRFAPAGLSAKMPVGIWGYSGGGHASASAAELQPTYAPELDIAGVQQRRLRPRRQWRGAEPRRPGDARGDRDRLREQRADVRLLGGQRTGPTSELLLSVTDSTITGNRGANVRSRTPRASTDSPR